MRGVLAGPRAALLFFFLFLSLLQLVLAGLIDPASSSSEEAHQAHADLGSRDLVARSSIAKAVPLRILCLGASITFGLRSTGGNGYRYALRGKLVQQGNDVNMVGTVRAGNMSNNNVDGWPGYRISQIAAKAKAALPEMPNVVLICAGTNDMIQDDHVSTAHERLAELVDHILDVVPGTTVIVATLPPNAKASTEANILTFNANLPGVVSERARAGKRVALVDMHSNWFSLADIGPDGTHPTDLGYLKMSRVWYTGIVAAAAAGNISAPVAVKGIDDYRAGNDSSAAGTAMNVVCQSVKGETMGTAQKQQCSASSRVPITSTYLLLGFLLLGYLSTSKL